MEKVGFHILGMVQPAADAAAIRDADRYRGGKLAVGAIVGPGRLANQLVHRRPQEIGELHFRDGAQAAKGGSQGDAHYRGFGQGHINNPAGPELLDKAPGRQKDAAAPTHILPHHKDGFVPLHLLPHRFPDGFNYAFDGHISYPCLNG